MRNASIAATLGVALLLAGCATDAPESRGPGSGGIAGDLAITGSSTVYPIGQAWAEEFQRSNRDVQVSYNVVGTGGGFQVFCRGEAAMTGASRPIKAEETAACAGNGVEPYEIQVAIDALSVVVSTKNTFAHDLTVTELNRIWTADTAKQVDHWDEVRPGWPHEKIELFGPGTDSGTFDYFIESIIHPYDGKATKGRGDYTPSEDDNALVQGIHASPYALGYFGLAYVHENAGQVRALKIDGEKGAGPIEPTEANVHAGAYAPLARPIFYYTDGAPAGVAKAFLEYGFSEEGQGLVTEVGYITMPSDAYTTAKARVSG